MRRRAWRDGGTEALRSKGPVPRERLSPQQWARLELKLQKGPLAHEFNLVNTRRAVSGTCRVALSLPGARWSVTGGLARGDVGIIDRSLKKSAMLMAMRIRNTATIAAISATIVPITTSSIFALRLSQPCPAQGTHTSSL